jgi:hypothetical protein
MRSKKDKLPKQTTLNAQRPTPKIFASRRSTFTGSKDQMIKGNPFVVFVTSVNGDL